MAKYCANCGHELREGDKFCAGCGTPAGGVAMQAQPARRGHWEYAEFAADLGGQIVDKSANFRLDGGLPDE